ncbi:MAG TPA: PadR family transcriptional regulator [Nitrososphaerales archaeon]
MIPPFSYPWSRGFRWVGRGDSRLLVLEVLKKRPMHGYEVSKEISEMFNGLYEPSAGVIYPTLQWLEDEGYVELEHENGKKVYRITKNGLKFLEEKSEFVEALLEAGRGVAANQKIQVIRAGKRLAQTLFLLHVDMTDEKAKQATKILDDARQLIAKLVSE